MAIFVQQFWKFPDGVGSGFINHTIFLVLINSAMTIRTALFLRAM